MKLNAFTVVFHEILTKIRVILAEFHQIMQKFVEITYLYLRKTDVDGAVTFCSSINLRMASHRNVRFFLKYSPKHNLTFKVNPTYLGCILKNL